MSWNRPEARAADVVFRRPVDDQKAGGPDMLDLHRLRILRELQLRGTMAAVASAMSYAPSTISEQLAQLESETGVQLLEHVGRNVRLTRAAAQLVAHTERLIEIVEVAERDLAAASTRVAGTIRVAAFQTVALAVVPRALKLLAERHPALRVDVAHLEPQVSLPALQARDSDLVIAPEFPGQPLPRAEQFDHQLLRRDAIELALPGGESLGDGQLGALAGRAWVMEEDGTPAQRWAMARCREAGFEPDVQFVSPDLLVHVALVEAGLAVGFLPELVWAGRRSSVVRQRIAGEPAYRRVVTVVRRGAGGHPALMAVRVALRDASELLTATSE